MSRLPPPKPRKFNLLERLVQGDTTPVLTDETDSDQSGMMGQSYSDQVYEDDFEEMWEESINEQSNHKKGENREEEIRALEENMNNEDIPNMTSWKSPHKPHPVSTEKYQNQQTHSVSSPSHSSKKRSPRVTRQRKKRSISPDNSKLNKSPASSRSSSPENSWMSLESNKDETTETRTKKKSETANEKFETRSDDGQKATGEKVQGRRPHSAKQDKPLSKGRRPLSARSDDDHQKRKHTRPLSGKRNKLLAREELRKFRSLELNPDVFLEERLQQKYTELQELLSGSTGHQKSEMTRSHLRQLELLREQYTAASHGVPPSGVLIPRSLPKHIRTKGQSSGSGAAGDDTNTWENGDLSDLADDVAYRTMRSVTTGMHGRRKQRVRTDIQANRLNGSYKPIKQKKKKPKVQKALLDAGSEKNLEEGEKSEMPKNNTNTDSASTGSQKKQKIFVNSDHQLKKTNNPEIRQWLHQKNVLIRKQRMAERAKQKEERQKLILEANDKLEKRLESQQKVSEWMTQKRLELVQSSKLEKQHRQKEEEQKRLTPHKVDIVLPDKNVQNVKSRPWSAPSARGGKQASQAGLSRQKSAVKEEDLCGDETPRHVRDVLEAEKLGLEEKNQAKTAERVKKGGPHPPSSKFIYKRPVAGRIKFKMQKDNNKTQTDVKKEQQEKENEAQKQRMSYDDWIVQKRKADLDEKRRKNMLRDQQLTQSDPELNKIVPDLARRRIDNIMANKKRVNTGIKHIDDEANQSFGGGDFQGDVRDGSPESSEQRFSYRLPANDESGSDQKIPSKPTVKRNGMSRPQTAPSNARTAPSPKPSTESPRKVTPVRLEVVMANQDNTNPFTLPFPPEKGVPAHVAAKQRQLFSEQIWQKLENERPEPQGCDAVEEAPSCSSPQLMITANSAVLNERQQTNTANMSSVTSHGEPETREVTNEDTTDSDKPMQENMVEDHVLDENDNSRKPDETYPDVSENNIANEEDTEKPSDRVPSRNTGKRVSFCEQTQVFEPEEEEYSTDTATPDESMWWGEVVEDVEGILERARRQLMENIGNEGDGDDDDDDDDDNVDYFGENDDKEVDINENSDEKTESKDNLESENIHMEDTPEKQEVIFHFTESHSD